MFLKIVLIFVVASGLALPTVLSKRKLNNLGLTEEGHLFEVPKSPNAVSSQTNNKSHFVEPISYGSDKNVEDIKKIVTKIIDNYHGAHIVKQEKNYIRAEFRTFLGFVDDVEFLIDNNNKLINFRSASRVGYSDLGKNRKRYEELKKRIILEMEQ